MDTTDLPLVEMISLATLKPDPKNPRTISVNQFEDLQRNIDQFGIVEPLVVNRRNMEIVGGHQRKKAAEALGITSVPVVWVDLDRKLQTTLNISLNKLGGDFDMDMLPELILELDEDLLGMTGFGEDELSKLQPDPFDNEEEPKKPKVAKFSLDELRTMAKSYHPEQAETIVGFLDWLEERAS